MKIPIKKQNAQNAHTSSCMVSTYGVIGRMSVDSVLTRYIKE